MTCLDVVLMPLLTGSLFDHDEFAALAHCFIQPDSGLTKGEFVRRFSSFK